MKPTASDVHVNRPLTMISIAYMQSQDKFIASKAFPNIPVLKQGDRYFTYDRGDFNRDQMQLRAPGTESAGGGYGIDSTPTYFASKYGLHKDIDDDTRANSDDPLRPDQDATNWLTTQALIRKEKLWTTNYLGTGIWTTDLTGVASGEVAGTSFRQWNDAASTPIEDIRAGITAVEESTGFTPNKLVLGKRVFDKLVDHPDLVDRVKYGQTAGSPAMVNMQALAALLGLDEVLVMRAIENTANEGATNSHSFIGGKKALLVYAAPSPGLQVPSAGYTFSWSGLLGAGAEGTAISRFRMDHLKADRIEIEMAMDMKKVAADLGYFFNSAIA